ncbi:TPR and ankyrin repeat-containing protein 1-like [Liolophura sinensis]|uniref:TPR and ankyrin repeat-containing protein 1-like n=1 Tax=Liolophura sinensis TaxID=3198878 RepID=UPI003158C1B8
MPIPKLDNRPMPIPNSDTRPMPIPNSDTHPMPIPNPDTRPIPIPNLDTRPTCPCRLSIDAPEPVWKKLLKKLSEENNWNAIRHLVGESPPPRNALSGAAKGRCATEVDIKRLLYALTDEDLSSWGLDVTVALLRRGASVDTILLEEPGDKANTKKQYLNGSGDSPLHIVVKSGMADTPAGVSAITLLLDHGVGLHIPDRYGKLPIEYLNPTDEVYDLFLKKQPQADQALNTRQSVCDLCRSRLCSAKELHRKGRFSMVMEVLCKIVSERSHESKTHSSLCKEAEEMLSVVLEKLTPSDISYCMTQLSRNVVQRLVYKMAESYRWQIVADLIRAWRQANPGSETMAEELYINNVISSNSLFTRSGMKSEVIQVLLDNGARLRPSRKGADEPVSVAVERKEFRVISVLLDHSLSPKNIQWSTGDPPLHVALKVALDWDKGWSGVQLISPSIADKHGNTLLDVIGKYGTSCHTERAVDLLRRWTQTRGDDQPTMSPVQGDRLTMVSRATTLRKGIKTAQSKVVKARQSAADKPNASSSSKTVIIDFINRESEDWTKEDEPLAGEKKRSYLDYKAHSGNSIVSLPAHKIEKGNAEMVDNETNKPLKLETDFELDTRVFDHLAWEVECTAEVRRTFQDRKWPYGLKKKAIDAIQRLGEGEWTDSLSKRVQYVSADLKLFEAKISKDARILWELAISFSPRLSHEQKPYYLEIIRVWDIVLDHDKLSHRIRRVEKSHRKGQTYLRSPKLVSVPTSRPSKTDNTRYRLPQRFTEAPEEECAEVVLSPAANPNDNEYNVLKFYDFSSDVVRRILQQTNENIDFPFKVTAVEQNIISLRPESVLLLAGRSGTGKTTCCLYRLWHSYKAYWSQALCEEPLIPRGNPAEASGCGSSLKPTANYRVDMKNSASSSGLAKQASHHETLGHLQQLFVTKNGILLSEVHKKFNELRNGCDLNSLYSRPDSLLSNKLQDIPSRKYPLFVTSGKLLLMLDASLPGETFFERSENGTSAADDVCLSGAESSSPCLLEARPSGNATSLGKISKRLVTYDVFVVELWPKIRAKSKFQPSLVWTEIFTFIKGSFQSLLSQKGYLTSAQYQEVGRKCAPNFTGNRGDIYKIFTNYETERKRNGLFDECDLILNLHRRLDKNVLGWKVDEMYVDETQDFTQAELSLLIRLCDSPNNMFLSGDTAQAIMRGISFRFADLKSLFYHTHDALPSSRVTIPKQVFQLTDNYRSHQGILSLASSIVDLMVDFFPESVDLLDRDQGVFPGPSPILLEFCSSKDLAVLLKDNQRLTSAIEFGAHQAIVVVNEAARSSIPEELRAGLVLTIEESKGLEFDDILLYNFFKDSDANDEWRIVTSYLHRLATARDEPQAAGPSTPAPVEIDQEAIQTSACRPLAFNPMKHRVLCSEFKRLYTAITRARVNLWIYDEDEKSRASVFDYFKARGLVRTITSAEDSEQETFAQMSSSADWTWRGDQFMERHSYDMAIKCYQKAGDRAQEHVAMAHAASRRARGLQANPSKMREEFLTAAKLYLVNCGMVVEAAECLVDAHETLLAARLYGKAGRVIKSIRMQCLCCLALCNQ